VTRALARVRIDPSGIDINEQVDLIPVDVDGNPVAAVELSPGSVAVEIEVSTAETSKTVPVTPDLQGTLPGGLTITSIATEPIDLGTVNGNADLERALVLPDGIRLGDGVEDVATVSLVVTVEQASRTILAGPVCQNVATGLVCQPQVSQIPVTVSGPRSIVAGLTAAQVVPVLNMAGLAEGTHQVTPTVALPGGVSLAQPLTAISVVLATGGP
jgi:YbbR domain-containing protein